MRTFLVYLLTFLLMIILPSWASPKKGSIHLTIEAFKSNKGKVLVAIYNSAQTYLDEEKALLKKIIHIQNQKATVKLDELPFGEYALVCFHDENSNQKLDKSMMGIPKEGFGFSNNAKPVFGPPSFAKCRIQLNQSEYYTAIKLMYF